jgi:hypothetical protein
MFTYKDNLSKYQAEYLNFFVIFDNMYKLYVIVSSVWSPALISSHDLHVNNLTREITRTYPSHSI